MKKILLASLLSLLATKLSARQQEPEISRLRDKLNNQQVVINQQRATLNNLSAKIDAQATLIDSLRKQTNNNMQNIQLMADDLGTKIQKNETAANDSILRLDQDVSTSRLYWIIGTLTTLLLGGIIYWLLGKRIQTSKSDVESQIRTTKKSLEEESVKLDNKLVEVLESQLKIKQVSPVIENRETDHSLALKVADEIVRMQKNISKMDEDTKGLKPLIKGIERIQNNFSANDYEMVNLLNRDYDEKMNIDVINFITDENLPMGRKVISAVIKPQVNYKGVLIQRAQVDVSQH